MISLWYWFPDEKRLKGLTLQRLEKNRLTKKARPKKLDQKSSTMTGVLHQAALNPNAQRTTCVFTLDGAQAKCTMIKKFINTPFAGHELGTYVSSSLQQTAHD
jgi:hypothetical protein